MNKDKLFSLLNSTVMVIFWVLAVSGVIEIDSGASIILLIATFLDFMRIFSE